MIGISTWQRGVCSTEGYVILLPHSQKGKEGCVLPFPDTLSTLLCQHLLNLRISTTPLDIQLLSLAVVLFAPPGCFSLDICLSPTSYPLLVLIFTLIYHGCWENVL